MPVDALELRLSAADDALVRDVWEALRAAGLPSQADHRSASNAPHVTLPSPAAPGGMITGDEAADAAAVVGPLLPAPLRIGGTVLFGRDRPTVAWLLEASADLALAVERRSAQRDPTAFRPWIPHLSLARRVPRQDVGGVLAAVAPMTPREVVADRLLLWQPGPRTLTTLVAPSI